MPDTLLHACLMVAGVIIVSLVFFDTFLATLLPWPRRQRLHWRSHLSFYVISGFWLLWRGVVNRGARGWREFVLGLYAPLNVLLLLVLWGGGLLIGYSLMLLALAGDISPPPTNLSEAIYLSGVALLTIGFGDYVPTSGLARFVILSEGVMGLVLISTYIALIFAIYGSFQRREGPLVSLFTRAGSPPSGVTLLITYARLRMIADLAGLFGLWEAWCIDVRISHLTYITLNYIRSLHSQISWVSALGAMLDASTLVLTTVEGGPVGPASLFHDEASILVQDLAHAFHLACPEDVGVTRAGFETVYGALAEAGWAVVERERAWKSFLEKRTMYASALEALAHYWATPSTSWKEA